MSSDCILIYSGGLDSTVLLYELLHNRRKPHCLTFNYGQRHRREINCARDICYALIDDEKDVTFSMLDLTSITRLIASGSQTGKGPVPEGRYDAENMKTTIVPNRNMIMLSIAVGTAVAQKIKDVFYAAHAGDHAIYPDCRPGFVTLMDVIAKVANDAPVYVKTPFEQNSKADIVARGLALRVPFDRTSSCYVGFSTACGRCGTCVERLEAFAANSVEDPLPYADREYWRTVCGNPTSTAKSN